MLASRLFPGEIRQIDHVTMTVPFPLVKLLLAFWEDLAVRPSKRSVDRIDHLGPGDRLDFVLGADTTLTYAIVDYTGTDPFVGHVGLRVSPEAIQLLLEHPAVDRTQGRNGLVRHGTHDFSVFLKDPCGYNVEFRCPSAPAHLDDLLG